LHPSFKDLASAGDVEEEFLKVDVLVPELVYAGEEGDGAVKKVSSVVDVSRFELHVGVFELGLAVLG
jgi:hypothetical protein